MRNQAEIERLLAELQWILNQQSKAGGWPKKKPDIEVSGHVVFVLLNCLGAHHSQVERALTYLEKNYIEPELETSGYWAKKNGKGHINKSATLLCCYNLLIARELGRDLRQVNLHHLFRTAKDNVDASVSGYAHRQWFAHQGNFWNFLMYSMISNLKCFETEPIRGSLEASMSDTFERQEKWLDLFEYKEPAQGVLAGLCWPQIRPKYISDTIDYLLSKKEQVGTKKIYWPSKENLPNGAFVQTRWVLLALIECFEKDMFDRGILEPIIDGGVSWLLNYQVYNKRYSKQSGLKKHLPGAYAYTVLVLWKWLHAKNRLQQETLEILIVTNAKMNRLKQLSLRLAVLVVVLLVAYPTYSFLQQTGVLGRVVNWLQTHFLVISGTISLLAALIAIISLSVKLWRYFQRKK